MASPFLFLKDILVLIMILMLLTIQRILLA